MRLQKYLADAGVASRRAAEELISGGVVKVNGKIVDQLGIKIDPFKDKIEVGSEVIKNKPKKVLIKIYKPVGVLSSCYQAGEKTIVDYVKHLGYRLFPVGRLDKNSEGLMLLTNDGDLANKLMHPRHGHEKEYIVNVKYQMTNDKLRNLASGIILEGEKTLPARVKRLGDKEFSIILKEGKKRQIRRMVEAVGNRVVSLKRVRIEKYLLGDLKPGEFVLI